MCEKTEQICEGQGTGPSVQQKLVCAGCAALKLSDWSFECENDETDRGTDAQCTAADRHIASYYHAGDRAPDWCPALLTPRAAA